MEKPRRWSHRENNAIPQKSNSTCEINSKNLVWRKSLRARSDLGLHWDDLSPLLTLAPYSHTSERERDCAKAMMKHFLLNTKFSSPLFNPPLFSLIIKLIILWKFSTLCVLFFFQQVNTYKVYKMGPSFNLTVRFYLMMTWLNRRFW